MKNLLAEYQKKRTDIKDRLEEFGKVYKKDNKKVFSELCFCILTPQAKAIVCDRAIKDLEKRDLLLNGTPSRIRHYLKGVRFPNNKAKYLVHARTIFKDRKNINIKDKIDPKDVIKTRDWLVKNIKGMGYKEASHFLRNIGLGKDIAILDRHILKNLKRYGIIGTIPPVITKKEYLKIENKMRNFFKKLDISMDEIDLLFWSKETGIIFK